MVGRSGVTVERFAPVVPSARTWPSLCIGAIVVMASIIICTWPPTTLVRASPLPRWGTCTILVPLMALNSSPAM